MASNAKPTNAQRVHSELGQSLWYDNLQRGLLDSGAFQALLDAGVRGCTSNPTIFDKAITGSKDYEAELANLALDGKSAEEIYYALVTRDIQRAADLLRPVYDESQAKDGYVSLEVQPKNSSDADATIAEGSELSRRIGRPNLMIKVPATEPGLPAIRELIGRGISVNVTLVFAIDQYRQVANAYIDGLERAATAGKDLSQISSVASFFVSRLDSAIDPRLKKLGSAEAQALLGKAAIANARRAYQAYQQIFSSPRFQALAARGATPQRVLWASTGTKDPSYKDTVYVDELIGPDTVNTVPPATLAAFQDHGSVARTVDQGVAAADKVIRDLAALGIDVDVVCNELLSGGVESFNQSMNSLLKGIADRRQAVLRERGKAAE
ncbi:MAG: transaldolase [Polyangiaceae bacterium]